MRNISKKIGNSFSVICLLYIIAFLPAPVAAEESNNMQLTVLEEKINQTLSSELEKNPGMKRCRITIDLDFEKYAESGKWKGNISKILLIPEENISDELDTSESAVAGDDIDNEFKDDDTDDDEYSDEDSDGGLNVLGLILGSALVIILFVAIFLRLKPKLEKLFAKPDKEKQPEDNSQHRQTRRSDSLASNEHQTICNCNATKSNKMQQIDTEPSEAQIQTVPKTVPHEATVGKSPSTNDKSEPIELAPPVRVTKYGRIAVLSLNELTTEEDYMSDEAAGMPFVFSFSSNMQEGTYDISGPSRASFLRDVNIIRPFVQNFDNVPNPTKIVTINKGQLRRQGLSWVVTEKLKIQLM